MHQFLAADDGRGVEGADDGTQAVGDNDDDGAEDEVEKSAAEADDNDFDSEDTPEDSFIQLKASKKVSRSPIDGDDDDDDDEFEHGDVIAHAKDEDASDYSMHQFLAADDGRGVEGADDGTQTEGENDDDGAEDEVEKSAAEADDNDFDSEDTPDDDSFLQLKATTKAGVSRSHDDGDDEDPATMLERGEITANARDSDASEDSESSDDALSAEGAGDSTQAVRESNIRAEVEGDEDTP